MGLVSHPIPNLFNGISQQDDVLRAPNQAQLQENFYPTIATGNRKRPPTSHVAKLSSNTDANSFTHYINRDGVERYEVRIRNGFMEVWDLAAGVQCTVAGGSVGDANPYLVNSNPSTGFAAVTIADSTIVVNKAIATAWEPAGASVVPTSGKIAQSLSALPTTVALNDVYTFKGDTNNNFAVWYGKCVTAGAAGVPAAFQEVAAPINGNDKTRFTTSTMPFLLVRSGDHAFTFSQAGWADRNCGGSSDASFPLPSFIGYSGGTTTIQDIFFHRNRLGFLSGENVIMSRAGDYFNFFPKSAAVVTDADPIDKSVVHTKVSLLKSAQSFNDALILFSNFTQFQMTGGVDGTLTNKNAKLTPATEFESDALVRPIGVGQNLYFTVPKGLYTGVREYFVQKDTVTSDAADITAHCPTYIPSGVFSVAASSSEDVVVYATTQERNALYLYKFFWDAERKIQSAWFKFTLASNASIIGAFFINTKLYLSVDRPDGHYLEFMDFQANLFSGTLPFLVNLDRKLLLTGTYDSVNDWTTWTLPYVETNTMQAVLNSDWGAQSGSALTVTQPTTSTVRSPGNFSAHPVYLGLPYTSRYRFSKFYMRDQQGQVLAQAILKLKTLMLSFMASSYFRVEVTPAGVNRQTYKTPFTAKRLGVYTATMGVPSVISGSTRAPIMADSQEVTIEVINDSYLPSALLTGEWEAEMTTRSRRL